MRSGLERRVLSHHGGAAMGGQRTPGSVSTRQASCSLKCGGGGEISSQ